MDVIVIPSIYDEPLANVLIEAKHYGVPVVIFKSGGLPELVVHGENGYICDEMTSEALKEAIYYYLVDEHRRKVHAKNSRASITKLRIGFNSFEESWVKVFLG